MSGLPPLPSWPQSIVGLISIEGEKIDFCEPVETSGETNGVERWLLRTEAIIRKTLHQITKQALLVGGGGGAGHIGHRAGVAGEGGEVWSGCVRVCVGSVLELKELTIVWGGRGARCLREEREGGGAV